MADAPTSFADRAAQLIADFQRAMDTNAPVSGVMMGELKAVLDIGVAAKAKVEAIIARIGSANDIGKHMQADVAQLMASIGEVSNS